VSAALMRDPQYQEFVLGALAQAGGTPDFGVPSDWTFVFAIATSRPGPLKELMLFFAKASLVSNLQSITDKGFKVALTKIRRT
jgi:uncharacterized protein (TIGR04141 family)